MCIETELKEFSLLTLVCFLLNSTMLSLEKLSFDLIIQNFELFYFAYSVSKDDNLQRKFDFLQRRFSAELAKTLYEAHKLKEEYLEFLINEHLDHLEDEWLRNSRYRYSMKDIFLHLPNLKNINTFYCDDEMLKNLAKFCPKIVEIDVRRCRVTDNGVKYLWQGKNGIVPCPELKNLFISRTRITDSGAEYLIHNLPSLERLDYENVPLLIHSIHEKHLLEFKTVRYYNLVELNFLQPEFRNLPNRTDILKTCLTACPKLKTLSCYISDKEQLTLLTNTHLKKLDLEFPTTDPKINIDNFLKMKVYNINSLTLTDCTMSISALGLHFPFLEEFCAEQVIFSDDYNDEKDLKFSFASLSECNFTRIEPSSHKAMSLILSSSLNLERVTFRNCMLSLELKTIILLWCKNPSAKTIKLNGIHVASEMAFLGSILLKCVSLKEMWLFDTSMYYTETKIVEMREKLQTLAKSLPNKPQIVF